MFTSIIKSYQKLKWLNVTNVLNIELMMNVKAAMQDFKNNNKGCFCLNHTKCTHILASI